MSENSLTPENKNEYQNRKRIRYKTDHRTFNGQDEGKIVETLRKNKNLTISLVSEIDGKLAGHIAYSTIRDKDEEVIGIGLAPVAVLWVVSPIRFIS